MNKLFNKFIPFTIMCVMLIVSVHLCFDRQLQFVGERHLMLLEGTTVIGDSLQKVDAMLQELQELESASKVNILRVTHLPLM